MAKRKQSTSLLMTQPQADFLADALEEGIETSHLMTVENAEGTDEYKYGLDRLAALSALLEQIDPENPIFDAEIFAGEKFDWDSFWGEQDAPEEDVADADPVAPASEAHANSRG